MPHPGREPEEGGGRCGGDEGWVKYKEEFVDNNAKCDETSAKEEAQEEEECLWVEPMERKEAEPSC